MAATGNARDYSRGVFVAAIVATAAEAASNALFAYELGGHFPVTAYGVTVPLDAAALGAVAVAIAIFQARAATLLFRDGVQLVPALFLVACVTYSSGAMSAHLFKLQRLQADREADARRGYTLAETALRDAAAERDRLAAELAGLGSPRPVAEIKAAMDAADVPARIFSRSVQCTDITEDRTREACKPITDLRQELGRAYRAAELAPEIATAAGKVERSRKALAGIQAPAVPSARERFLADWLPWLFAGVIELTATFGFALAYRPAPRRPRVAATPDPVPAAPTPSPTPKRPVRAAGLDVAGAVEKIRAGGLDVPGARVVADGWVELSQRALGEALGVSASTVNTHVAAAVAANRLAKRAAGRGMALKVIYPPISAVS